MTVVFKFLRADAARWALKNPVLRAGEPGLEIDTNDLKIGDGVTPWNDLPYHLDKTSIAEMVAEMIVDSGGGGGGSVTAHINSPTPHPVYDDGPSLTLLYENAKV